MRRLLLLAATVTALLAAPASAYLIVLDNPSEKLKDAASVFEATILDMAADGDGGTVTVRVTDDWTRIYLGHRFLGTTRTLAWTDAKVGQGLAVARKEHEGRVLLAVGRTGGLVELVAFVPNDVFERGYQPSTAGTGTFETLVVESRGRVRSLGVRSAAFLPAALYRRWSTEVEAFHRALTRRLVAGPASRPDDDAIREAIADLGHPDYRRRADAQRTLRDVAASRAGALRAALETTADPEARRRLRSLIGQATERAAVERAAGRIEARGSTAVAAATAWTMPPVSTGPHVVGLGRIDLGAVPTFRPARLDVTLPTVRPWGETKIDLGAVKKALEKR